MGISVGLQGNNNNPGDLTVNKDGQLLYPGQTSTYKSPNGLIYAVFGSMQAGYNALVDYAQRHIAKGWNTPDKYVGGYLNGTPDKLASTAANPYPQAYLKTFDKYGGFTQGETLTSADAQNIAVGVIHAEGNTAALSQINTGQNTAQINTSIQQVGTNFGVGLDTLVHDPSLFFSTAGSVMATGAAVLTMDPVGSLGTIAHQTTDGADAITGAASEQASALTSLLGTALSFSTIERAVLVILGLLLLAAGLFALTRPAGSNINLGDVSKLAALAA